jgi:hypothetical protein
MCEGGGGDVKILDHVCEWVPSSTHYLTYKKNSIPPEIIEWIKLLPQKLPQKSQKLQSMPPL